MYEVDRDMCTGCELCVDSCPVGAIEMVDGAASIDQDVCEETGTCAEVCPVEAISQN